MAGVKEISQIFRVTPRQGERRSPAECSRKNIQIPGKLRPGRKYGRRMFRQKVSPLRKAPRTRQKEKSPEKIWQEEGKFPSMACALPFPLRSRNMPRSRGICGTDVCRKKAPPGEKPVAEHAAAQEAPEKKSPQAPDLLPKRAEREAAQEKTAEYRWRKPCSARRAEKLPEARPRHREKTGYGKGS